MRTTACTGALHMLWTTVSSSPTGPHPFSRVIRSPNFARGPMDIFLVCLLYPPSFSIFSLIFSLCTFLPCAFVPCALRTQIEFATFIPWASQSIWIELAHPRGKPMTCDASPIDAAALVAALVCPHCAARLQSLDGLSVYIYIHIVCVCVCEHGSLNEIYPYL